MIDFNSSEFNIALYKLYPQIVKTIAEVGYDANDNVVNYDSAAVQAEADKLACRSQAIALLAATDWAVLPDVGLANQADFVFYRLNLRNLVRNPVANPVFGTEPTPVWS
jgi:hypothetical protein